MPTTDETPRETRLRLNRLEAWCARNPAALGPRAVYLRSLFEVAVTAEHADFLAGELREVAEPTDSDARIRYLR